MPNNNFKPRAGLVSIPLASTIPETITAEAVAIPAGAAGTVVNFYLERKPIYDSHKNYIGGFGDSSVVLTSTAFATEVSPETEDANLANGEYWIDYVTGKCRGKKADNSVALTATYNVPIFNISIETGDIEIGAVEIKNATTDERASVEAANTARTTATKVLAVQEIGADGTVPPTGSLLTNAPFAKITDGVTNVDILPLTAGTVSTGLLSVAGEVVDFDTGAGTDATPVMGVLGASAGGAKPLYLVADDAEMDATPTILPVGGEYRAAATTYTDGDAVVLQTDINGNLKVTATGTSKYENASYAETEDETNDSEFSTAVMYGLDTEAAANSQLRAMQVAADNAGISATPNVLVSGGIYKNAFDTYDDNDAVPLHFNASGQLLVNLNDGVTALDILPLTAGTASTGLLSVAGEIVDFDTSGGTDATPVIGILGASSGGAKPLYLVSDDAAMDATPTILPIGGEYRAVETTYTDGDATVLQTTINGHLKTRADGYDTATDSMKSFEVSPLDQHYVEESLVDTTNLAAVANYYPSSTGAAVGAYKDFSFTGKLIEGVGSTITFLVQGTNDEDTASADWITVYGYRDDTNTTVASIAANNATVTFSWSFNDFNYKYYRIVMTPDSADNTAIVKLRKKAL